MTTATVTTVIDHTSDAGFRAWVAEFIAQLLAVGVVQTSDTGQINTATATRPGTNTDGGYAVFRMNDTMQATAPVFFKVFFGTGSAATRPRIRVQTGTASNGTGTVSGLGSANTDEVTATQTPSSTITTYASYFCCVDGCLWWSWKIGAATANMPHSFYKLERSVDNDGDPTATALVQTIVTSTGPTTATARTISYAESTIYGAPAQIPDWMLFHYAVTTSLVGGVPQVFKGYYITPRVRPLLFSVGVLDAECSRGVQLQATVVGVTQRNYINVANAGSTSRGLACIWE